MDIKLILLYFFLGGAVVAAITYFGGQGKGMFAAFIGVLPSVTIITISSIYYSAGTDATLSYIKGLIILMPPWLLYILAVIFLLPRIGLPGSLSVGLALYLIGAFIIIRLFPSA